MIFFPDIYYDIIIYRLLMLYNLSSKVFSMYLSISVICHKDI